MSGEVSIELPEDFRTDDFLAFHRRDDQAVAERVEPGRLSKGVLWRGWPACLVIELAEGRARAALAIDGPPDAADTVELERVARHLLGLTQDVEAFEQAYRDHLLLGRLIRRQRGLRIPQSFSPFEALSWAVTGQQITVKAAIALRRRLILAADVRHSSGIFCYPGAGRVGGMDEETLRQAGFSATKTRTLLTLGRLSGTGQLPLETRTALPIDVMAERLLAVRGIGPWTVSYALLRGFAWLDGSLHGDVAVRRGLKKLLGSETAVTEQQAQAWLLPFSPWRALVAAHLWACSADEKQP